MGCLLSTGTEMDSWVMSVASSPGISWHEVCPIEVDVMLPSVNKGTEEVEVVSSCVHADEDDTVLSAQGEDGRGREAITVEVGVLVYLSVICAVVFFAVEGVYE